MGPAHHPGRPPIGDTHSCVLSRRSSDSGDSRRASASQGGASATEPSALVTIGAEYSRGERAGGARLLGRGTLSSKAFRAHLRSSLITGALAFALGGVLAGSASAGVYSGSVIATGGQVKGSGSASKACVLFVLFAPARCAATLNAEGIRPDLGSWGGIVEGNFKRSFG